MMTAEEAREKTEVAKCHIEEDRQKIARSNTEGWVRDMVPKIERYIDAAIEDGLRVCWFDFDVMTGECYEDSTIQIAALKGMIESYHYTVVIDLMYSSTYNLNISW
jgi:hypothetical protein